MFRRSNIVWLGVAVGLGISSLPCPGQGDFMVEVWDADSGLPDSTVTSIAQTPDGYLWVGTLAGGLARFDGSQFVDLNPVNTPQLQSIEIQKLLVDARGTLWVGTSSGTLSSYRDGRFRFERQSTETPQAWLDGVLSAGSNSVALSSVGGWLLCGTLVNGTNRWQTIRPPEPDIGVSLCADGKGVIWYRTSDGHLGQVQGNRFMQLPDPPGLSNPQLNTLITDAGGRLWAGTAKGIAMWSGKKFVDMTPTNGEPDISAQLLAACPDGALWVWTDHGLRKCRGRQWVARVESWEGEGPTPAITTPSTFGNSLSIHGDVHGGLWVVHYRDGLWHVDADGKVSRVREAQGLPNKLVECWFEDREGNIWIGLNRGGLACVRPRLFHTVWPADGAARLAPISICEDPAGTMWFGTSLDTLLRWRNREFRSFSPPVAQTEGFNTIIYPGDPGQLWVGNVQNGVVTLEEGKFSRPFAATDIGTVARVIYRDRSGRVWMGSEFGLYCWEAGRLKRFSAADGFPTAYVLAITQDAAGDLWIGTAMGELWRYHEGRFTNYRPPDSPTSAQAFAAAAAADSFHDRDRGAMTGGERFLALHADEEEAGVIWIGTLSGGLLRFQNAEFTRYTARDGLPDDNVSQILEDGRGHLWLGTRAGIARVNQAALKQFAQGEIHSVRFDTYGKVDGLPTVECSDGGQPACWRSQDGRLWFATTKGVVWIDPTTLRFNPIPPPVVIEEVSVDGRRRAADGSARQEPADRLPARMEVSPGHADVEFKFAALSFTSPDKVRFRWRLAGLEKDWGHESSQRSASYSFVPPGNYVFQVQACNHDGVWNRAGAAIRLTVQPYFWQTWWFRIGAPMVGIGLAGGAMFAGLRRRQRLQLQRLEHARALVQARLEHQQTLGRERTRIAQDLHDDLGASLTHIAWMCESARSEEVPTAERQNLLALITVKSRDMVRSIDEIVWTVNPKNDSLDHLITYVCEFAEQFFHDTSTRCRVDVPESLPALPLPSDLRHNLFLIAKEALHNVAKHAAASRVWVRFQAVNGSVQFTIEDDGRGCAPATQAAGDGLENMRRRAAVIGAEFAWHSTPGTGTSVVWRLPLDSSGQTRQNHPWG